MSSDLTSPTIFDKMLGFAHSPGLPQRAPQAPKKDDQTHRFYVCQKLDKGSWSYDCQRGTMEQVCSEATARRRALPGAPIYTGVHVMDIKAGCPAWNDQLVLASKLKRPVILGAPLEKT